MSGHLDLPQAHPSWPKATHTPTARTQFGGPAGFEPDRSASTSQDPERRVKLTPASEIGPLPVRWLWQDRIPIGEITLTAGFAGVGKSTFHAYIIAGVTTGTLAGVHEGTPQPVNICAREDSWQRSIVPRLMAAGADLDLVYRAEVETGEGRLAKVTLPADNDALEAEIQRLGVALVSVDPLLSAIEDHLDSYKSAEIRDAPRTASGDGRPNQIRLPGQRPLPQGQRCDASTQDRRRRRFRRSRPGGNRLRRGRRNRRRGHQPGENQSRHQEPAQPHLPIPVGDDRHRGRTIRHSQDRVHRRIERSVAETLNPPRSDEDRGAEDIARDRILDTLEAGPQSWEDIAKALKGEGISERTGRRARDDLRKSGLIGKSGGGGAPWMWHRKVVGQSRVGLDKWPSSSPEADEVGQGLDNGLSNGDAYLSNLAKEEKIYPRETL